MLSPVFPNSKEPPFIRMFTEIIILDFPFVNTMLISISYKKHEAKLVNVPFNAKLGKYYNNLGLYQVLFVYPNDFHVFFILSLQNLFTRKASMIIIFTKDEFNQIQAAT